MMIPTMMMMMLMMISTWSNSSRLLLTCIATSCSIWPWTWFSFLCGDDYQQSLIQFTRSQSRSLSPAVVWSLQSVALFPLPKFEPSNVFVQLCFIIHTKLYSIIFNIPWPYSHKYYLFECKPLSPPNFSNFYAALPSKLCIVRPTLCCAAYCVHFICISAFGLTCLLTAFLPTSPLPQSSKQTKQKTETNKQTNKKQKDYLHPSLPFLAHSELSKCSLLLPASKKNENQEDIDIDVDIGDQTMTSIWMTIVKWQT